MAKVIHVHLLQGSHDGQKDFYFASMAAVFTILTPGELGISEQYIRHIGLGGNGSYLNKKCCIRQGTLITKKREA